MAGGHSHSRGGSSDVAASARPRLILLLALALVAVATLVGLFRLWPDEATLREVGGEVEFSAPGVTYPHATITEVQRPCTQASGGADQGAKSCGQMSVTLDTGPDKGTEVMVPLVGPQAQAGLRTGDSVQMQRIPGEGGGPASYALFGVDRGHSLLWMTLLFVLVVGAVARLRGLLALVGLAFSGVVIVKFMMPALLSGGSGLAVAVVGATAIMYVVLYVAHGPTIRTSTALAGTLIGVAITAALAHVAVDVNRLSGIGDETSLRLQSLVGDLDFRGLLTCAIIVAGLGVLNDVTITQSSAVWELRAAAPDLPRRELFTSAMRIGRDHIASTIYTIVFAYAGAALSVLLVLYLYDRPLLDLLGTEDIAIEVVRTLASSIGLVLAVPVTTAIAVATVAGPGDATPRRHRH
ncbi:YibE/F family protein [Nocardioides sp.]|uniref:YibE/F family protein n=1 Tax=Nocardioides sp. TaxID=35761 RepID=UPI003D1202F5